MDLYKMIAELYEERKHLDRLISALEEMLAGAPHSRRGRRSMSAAERKQVSQRMKRYWAKKKRAAN